MFIFARRLALVLAGTLLALPVLAEGDDPGLQGGLEVDRLEMQKFLVGNTEDHYWHADGWVGSDTNKLFLKSEGAHWQGYVSGSLNQVLYGRSVSDSWTLEAGGARSGAPGPSLNWAVIAAEGDLPYSIDSEWTLLWRSHLAWLKAQFETAVPLGGAWKFVPKLELNLYSANDPANQLGSGLSNGELALRIARDLSKHTAAYVGYSRYQTFGATSGQLRAGGGQTFDNVLIAGLMISL
jgi:copper resistance protein B